MPALPQRECRCRASGRHRDSRFDAGLPSPPGWVGDGVGVHWEVGCQWVVVVVVVAGFQWVVVEGCHWAAVAEFQWVVVEGCQWAAVEGCRCLGAAFP